MAARRAGGLVGLPVVLVGPTANHGVDESFMHFLISWILTTSINKDVCLIYRIIHCL